MNGENKVTRKNEQDRKKRSKQLENIQFLKIPKELDKKRCKAMELKQGGLRETI